MALIECSECGRQISTKAPACPQCGAPMATAAPSRPSGGGPTASPGEVPPPPARRSSRLLVPLLGVFAVVGFFTYKSCFGLSSMGDRRPPPDSLGAIFREPQKVVSERISLKEGQAMMYTFTLPTSRRVEVKVRANPKKVDVMLMTADDLAKFKRAMGKLFGRNFTYRRALSRESILAMTESEVLPAGAWAIVVQRPQESLMFGDDTAASVDVTVY